MSDQHKLETVVAVLQNRVTALEKRVQFLPHVELFPAANERKQIALKLRNAGFSYHQISVVLGVCDHTVIRYLS